jgi:A/G-specific adenine glycosylase
MKPSALPTMAPEAVLLLNHALQNQPLRQLPWRSPTLLLPDGTMDPYAIVVSEVMLQQTQVDRVVPYFNRWMEQWPTVEQLSRALQHSVLRAWSGLGYNRRALALLSIAKEVVRRHGGSFPKKREDLEALPGIGRYTAGALRVFAYNCWDEALEANGRLVVLHTIKQAGGDPTTLSERALQAIFWQAIREAERSGWQPRQWYWALMDYGASLRAQGIRIGTLAPKRRQQKPFLGSRRQVRGAILRLLLERGKPLSTAELLQQLRAREVLAPGENPETRFLPALTSLASEGVLRQRNEVWSL